MCPMISRRRSLEFELCRTAAAASPANPERCTSATTSPATVLTSESAVEEEKTGKTEVRKREEGGGAAGGDSFNRGELRVRVELDAPFSREKNPRSELWLFLPPSRSLTLLSTPLHFHGFGVDARLPRIDGGRRGGRREGGRHSLVRPPTNGRAIRNSLRTREDELLPAVVARGRRTDGRTDGRRRGVRSKWVFPSAVGESGGDNGDRGHRGASGYRRRRRATLIGGGCRSE